MRASSALELLRASDLDQRQRAKAEQLRASLTEITMLTAGLLRVARGSTREAGKAIALRELVGEVVAHLEPEAQARSIAIATRVPDTATGVGDRDALWIVLTNLLRNAISHSGGARVGIDWRDGALIVSDDGRGFDAGQGPGSRQRASGAEADEGLGLGLSIVERICEAVGMEPHHRQRLRSRHSCRDSGSAAIGRARSERLKPPLLTLFSRERRVLLMATQASCVPMDKRLSRQTCAARLLSHQATGTAVALFVVLWTVAMLVRITLAAIRWGELDHDPSALLAALRPWRRDRCAAGVRDRGAGSRVRRAGALRRARRRRSAGAPHRRVRARSRGDRLRGHRRNPVLGGIRGPLQLHRGGLPDLYGQR